MKYTLLTVKDASLLPQSQDPVQNQMFAVCSQDLYGRKRDKEGSVGFLCLRGGLFTALGKIAELGAQCF